MSTAPDDISELAPTPFHVAAYTGDFDLMQNIIQSGLTYPGSIDGNSPLAIAASSPPYYRMATLLCLAGADPFLELAPTELEDLPLLISCKLTSVGESLEDYNRMFIITVAYAKCIHIVQSVASGILPADMGADLFRLGEEEKAGVRERFGLASDEVMREEVTSYLGGEPEAAIHVKHSDDTDKCDESANQGC